MVRVRAVGGRLSAGSPARRYARAFLTVESVIHADWRSGRTAGSGPRQRAVLPPVVPHAAAAGAVLQMARAQARMYAAGMNHAKVQSAAVGMCVYAARKGKQVQVRGSASNAI